jgi:membrane protease subunit HflK
MSRPYDPNQDESGALGPDDVAEESDEIQPAPIRRAASAEFVVKSDVGDDRALRDAMDPANQSLAEALRLSFRVLQIVILVLIVLFIFSGVVTVQDNQSGVLTRWGKIVPYGGDEALDSGLKWSWWPYPVSEFILFEYRNRHVEIMDTFLPNNQARGNTVQQQIERTRLTDRYRTGVDGQLLTADGDIAHVAIDVNFEIIDPVQFVQHLALADADRIVRRAAEQAVINAVATITLQDLMEITEDVRQRIHESAQRALDDIDCGIRITQVMLPEPPRPPYAILNAFEDLQEARVQAENMVQESRRRAEQLRNGVAGQQWREIVALIGQYEDAEELSDVQAGEGLLASINTWLDSRAEGDSSKIISDARSSQTIIDSTLGNEAKRFASLVSTYREHPDLVVRPLWLNATRSALSRPDAETFYVPRSIGNVRVSISGLDEIAQLRRDLKLNRQNTEGWRQGFDASRSFMRRAEDMQIDRPGRQLDVEGGQVSGKNAGSSQN